MNQEQALNVLIQSVNIAQQKGAFNLQEAKIIAEAVEVFIKKPETPVEPEKKEEVKKEE